MLSRRRFNSLVTAVRVLTCSEERSTCKLGQCPSTAHIGVMLTRPHMCEAVGARNPKEHKRPGWARTMPHLSAIPCRCEQKKREKQMYIHSVAKDCNIIGQGVIIQEQWLSRMIGSRRWRQACVWSASCTFSHQACHLAQGSQSTRHAAGWQPFRAVP